MSNVTRFCCDDETGEIMTYCVNDETGEPSLKVVQPVCEAPKPPIKKHQKYTDFPIGYVTNTKKYQSLKANIIAGSNTVSHRLLLIPTVMFFPDILSIILVILEIFLHVRCHKKNKNLCDPTLYYRSPFHAITSAFCGVCREADMASKVGQLQDERRYRYDYFRGIAI